jgi:type IV secretory pathway VirB10-like protein
LSFETENLMQLDDKAVIPVLLYLFRRIEQRIDKSPTLVLLDEAWSYLQHALFRNRQFRNERIQAIQSPTSIRNSSASALGAGSIVPNGRSGSDDLSQVEALSRALGARHDYLRSTREAPLSRYEIKAGWEIPAVLEQSLNSDLPGELKSLVTSNVYDTATGLYLRIPQGSRLIGKYDSRVAYGQDGVQVAWSRIIYPDASSIDLDGMLGLDSHGNAGLRDQVDRHYRRLIGFSVLTSMFTRSSQSALTYPTPAQTAGSAVGQELSQTGAQITRRNLNVQPTIKVPAGYKFTVRVNRDILFEVPYEPVSPDSRHILSPSGAEGKN